MDGSEEALAAIPTDKLVLALLQELASRVERLEDTDKTRKENSTSASSNHNSFAQNLPNKELPNTERATTSQEAYHEWASEGVSVSAADTLCINPYGFLLDGDNASIKLKRPIDRLNEVSDPDVARLLKHLGSIVQVPADFRFELTNFWSLGIIGQKDILNRAVHFLDVLEQQGGDYWITDFDLKSNQVLYEYRSAAENSLEVPAVNQNRVHGKEKSSPWRRVIVLQGISEISSHLQTGYLRKNGELVVTHANPFFSVVSPSDAINTHFGRGFGQGTFLQGGYHFHLSWCRARRLPSHRTRSRQGMAELKVGRLYGSADQYLCQEAYTIHAIADDRRHGSSIDHVAGDRFAEFQRFWTILLLPPLAFYRRGLLKVPRVVSESEVSPLQINMVVLIEDALAVARRAWSGLHQYIDGLLGTGDEIFDPELHDSLLSDDELFSVSRKYFWLVNSLQTFDNVLRQNIEAWISYRDSFLLPLSYALSEVGVTWKEELDEGISLCDKSAEDLGRLRKLFKDQRERTLALREGLFSASAVIESRASTRLGENVKLLTYVSIFYLPLAFCTSLWSTTDTFGFANLAYVMVAVGLTTYILVFNLNRLAKAGQARYLRFKENVIEEMMSDTHSGWMETGMKFNSYKPRNLPKESKPSEWWVFVYQILRIVRLFGISRRVTFLEEGREVWKIVGRGEAVSSAVGPQNSRQEVVIEDLP